MKKTPKKTISSPKKAKKLTKAEIADFKQMLLEKRREIIGNVNEMEDETLRKSRTEANGDLSCMPIHMADLGTDNYEQEFALGLMDSEVKLLKKIDDALKRIQEGTFGICEATGERITKARLQAKPWAKYSVKYAEKLENGQIQ